MKKILCLFLLLLTVTACSSNSYEWIVNDIINDELHEYILQSYYDYETDEVITSKISNEIAISIIILKSYYSIDLDIVFKKANSSLDDITSYYENLEISDIYTAYNMILSYKLLGLDLSELEKYCDALTFDDLGYYDYLTAINCFNMLEVNDKLKNDLIDMYKDFDSQSYMDADYAAMIVVALQGEADYKYQEYLIKSVNDNKVVNYSGEFSCSSTSQVQIAFMSLGLIYSRNSLVDSLMDFKTTSGFKEYLMDEESDLSYASPQAFLAISMTYLNEQTGNKVILY